MLLTRFPFARRSAHRPYSMLSALWQGRRKRHRRSREALARRPIVAAEVLEDRTLLSVDAFIGLAANGTPTLFVFDDSDLLGNPNQQQDNTVTVSRSGDLVRISDPLGVFTDGTAAGTGAGFAEFDVADFDALHIDLQDGNDRLTFDRTFDSTGIASIFVSGGGPSGSDSLFLLSAAGESQTVTIRPNTADASQADILGFGVSTITSRGYETIVFDGQGNDDTLIVNPGPVGAARVQNSPTDARGQVASDTLPAIEWNALNTFRLAHAGLTSTRVDTFVLEDLFDATTFEYQGTSNTLVIEGGATANDWTLARDGDNLRITSATGLGTRALTVLPSFPGQIRFDSQGGNDKLTVNTSGGLIPVPLLFDGGGGTDVLVVQGDPGVTVDSVTYSPGAQVHEGSLFYDAAVGPDMVIHFTGLEPIVDLVPAATLIVNGTPADNAINYTQGSDATRGLVTIDNFESIEFSNKTRLEINAGAGSDTIHLNNSAIPTNLADITVHGGDPTASDRLIVNGRAGVIDLWDNRPTGLGAALLVNSSGLPQVRYTGIEELEIVQQLEDGDALRISGTAGNDVFELFPGLTADSGTFVGIMDQNNATGAGPFALPTITYRGVNNAPGTGIGVNVSVAGGDDTFIVHGTDGDDHFVLDLERVLNVRNGQRFTFAGAFNSSTALIIVEGHDGNDVFDVFPNAGVAFEVRGGNPSGSDVLNFNGSGGAIAVDLAARSITESGFGPVSFSGIEHVNVAAAGGNVLVLGTDGNDEFTVTPATSDRVLVTLAGLNTLLDVSAAGSVTVDPLGGSDVFNYQGRAVADDITVTFAATTTIANAGLPTVGVVSATTEVFNLFGNDGDDVIVLTGDASLIGTTTVDGGDGHDTIDASGVTAGGLILMGGAGDDSIVGGAGDDLIAGGEGRDTIRGGPGRDTLFGGADSDVFVWNPGDGSDVIEGGGGQNVLVFNGSGADETFELSADGPRLRLFRNVGNVAMDVAGVQRVDLAALGGQDHVTIHDLSLTEVRLVNVLLEGPPNGSFDDGAADTVTVHGTAFADNISITGSDGVVEVAGLAALVRITGASPSDDRLIVRGHEGNDTITAAAGVENTIAILLDGGPGDDFLSGSGTLMGGAGNDFLQGGAGDDLLLGGDGDDTFVGGGGNDTIDGGAGVDSILIRGTPGNDIISVHQTSPTELAYTVNGTMHVDTLVTVGGARTVEIVRIEAGAGSDLIRLNWADALGVDGSPNAVRFDVDGGPSTTDRLVVIDDADADLTLYRRGLDPTTGQVTIGPGNAEPLEAVFTNINFVQFLDEIGAPLNANPDGARVVVFKPDPFELNDDRFTATHIGANEVINFDPTIDPGALLDPFGDGLDLPADRDFYRVQALATGTLDFQVFFTQIGTIPASGRPGLPGDGNLDILVRDADGDIIAGLGPNFGTNDPLGVATDHERIRIPAVQGQIYYLEVFGATLEAVNVYNLTIINTPALVPFDLELDDVLLTGVVVTTSIDGDEFFADPADPANAGLAAVDDVYVGKLVQFTSSSGGEITLQRAFVTAYVAATGRFTLDREFSRPPVPGDVFQIESGDTGRSQFDNVTRDSTPRIFLRLDDAFFLNDVPGNNLPGNPLDEVIPIPFQPGPAQPTQPGYAIAIFDEGSTLPQTGGPVQTPVGFATLVEPGLYVFDFGDIDGLGTPFELSDGSHFITARVQMIDPGSPAQTGFGPRSASLEIIVDTAPPVVFFGSPGDPNDGLLPGSDTGVLPNPHTLIDRVTSNTTPTFWGRAEANTVVQLYLDTNGNSIVDDGDIFLGLTVALPFDGTNQFPGGYWEITSTVALNSPAVLAALNPGDPDPAAGGLRRILATAEDLAGNLNETPAVLEIFLDTQGPRVFDPDGVAGALRHPIEVLTRNVSGELVLNAGFNIFDIKPSAGPTPRVDALAINVIDLPERVGAFLDLLAIKPDIAAAPGNIRLFGDFVGNVAIRDIIVTVDLIDGIPGVPGFEPDGDPDTGFATAQIILVFFEPLEDDRFTLVLSDSIVDFGGNRLDGESNAAEPNNNPLFRPDQASGTIPDGFSGDGVPGGDFIARFTVDSRPEVGVWGQAGIVIDANGNFQLDALVVGGENYDVSRDLQFVFGIQTDHIFAGQFKPAGATTVNGYDRIGAYGLVNGQYRFLLDMNDNGKVDPGETIISSRQINALPVAGNFDGNAANGDEIGLFDGTTWYLDTTGDNVLNATITGNLRGLPIVGDFDGDGLVDLATYSATLNRFFFSLSHAGGSVANGNSNVTHTFDFGFPGVQERPFAADFNLDGITDFGLTIPNQLGTDRQLEWYIIVSDPVSPLASPAEKFAALARPFSPTPLGNDLFFTFGNNEGVPVVGNFDPPLGPDQNKPPHVPVTDQSVSHNGGTVTIPLPRLDPDGDFVNYDVAVSVALDLMAQMAYEFDQLLNLSFTGNFHTNWGGAGEVWLMGDTGWHFLTPGGDLYQWNGSNPGSTFLPGSTLIGTLGPLYHEFPHLLYDAPPPETVDPPPETDIQILDGHVIVISGIPYYVGDLIVTVTASDGVAVTTQNFTVTYTNEPPELDLPPVEIGYSYGPLFVELPELDADGDPLTYEVELLIADELALLAYQLNAQLGLYFTGNYSLNWGGANEIWLQTASSAWHFVTPGGTLYQWTGSKPGSRFVSGSIEVARLDASYYSEPAKLYDAQPPLGDAGGSTVTIVDNQLVVTPGPSFTGQLLVAVTASDGIERRTFQFPVTVVNQPPELSLANQTVPHDSGPLVIDLPATDADGDAVTYAAQLVAGDPLARLAYELDQQLQLNFTGNYSQNWGGANERWLRSASGTWYFITPNGTLYRWNNSKSGSGFLSGSTVVATLDASYYNDPSRLYNARPPAGDAGGSTVEIVNGTQLVVTPGPGFVGQLTVKVTASDGAATVTATLAVEVTNTPPPLDVSDAQTTEGSPLVLSLPAIDADGDALTYVAELIDAVAERAWNLDQQLQLGFTGSYAQNWGGANERWMRAASGTWYFLTPNGTLYRWNGSRPGSSFLAGSTVVATLDSTYWADPSRLHNAQPPVGAASTAQASVAVVDHEITVTPAAGFTGSLHLRIRVSDGIVSVSRTITVTVVEAPPVSTGSIGGSGFTSDGSGFSGDIVFATPAEFEAVLDG